MWVRTSDIKIPLHEILKEGMAVEISLREDVHHVYEFDETSVTVFAELGAFKINAITKVRIDNLRELILKLLEDYEDVVLRFLLKGEF